MSDLISNWGSIAAILAMGLATYLCRIGGALLMSRVTLTGRIERGLQALPGSIVIATVAPIAAKSGPDALPALAVAVLVMVWRRSELLGLIAGIATVIAIRAMIG